MDSGTFKGCPLNTETFVLHAPHSIFTGSKKMLQKPLACFLNLNSTVKTQGKGVHSHPPPLMRFTGKGCGHVYTVHPCLV